MENFKSHKREIFWHIIHVSCESHKREIFWYIIHVSCERSDLIFVIGSQTLHRPILQCLESLRAGAFVRRPKPRQRGFAKTATTVGRDHRARRSGELRKRIRRPQHIRNISVLGFVAKPLTLHNEKPNTMVRRVAITRRTLFSCFSLRFLAAPATRRDFEGAPLFFSAPKRRCPVG